MSRTRKAGLSFLLALALTCASVGLASGKAHSAKLSSPVQESSVVGAGSSGCDFAAGLGAGLGVAGLFGCVFCAVAAVVVDVGAVIACT